MSYPEKKIVYDHVLEGHKHFYILLALTVMPEHFHIILHPMKDFPLKRIMKGIKGVTANKINLERKTKGSIWMDESYDRIIRNEKEFGAIANYMLNNPVERGLIDYPWKYEFWFFNEFPYEDVDESELL
ncbi:MAG: transposase [Ignavibacteria bacterium]